MVLDLQCNTHYPGNQKLTKGSLVKASSNGYQNTSFGGVGMTPMEWHVHALNSQASWSEDIVPMNSQKLGSSQKHMNGRELRSKA